MRMLQESYFTRANYAFSYNDIRDSATSAMSSNDASLRVLDVLRGILESLSKGEGGFEGLTSSSGLFPAVATEARILLERLCPQKQRFDYVGGRPASALRLSLDDHGRVADSVLAIADFLREFVSDPTVYTHMQSSTDSGTRSVFTQISQICGHYGRLVRRPVPVFVPPERGQAAAASVCRDESGRASDVACPGGSAQSSSAGSGASQPYRTDLRLSASDGALAAEFADFDEPMTGHSSVSGTPVRGEHDSATPASKLPIIPPSHLQFALESPVIPIGGSDAGHVACRTSDVALSVSLKTAARLGDAGALRSCDSVQQSWCIVHGLIRKAQDTSDTSADAADLRRHLAAFSSGELSGNQLYIQLHGSRYKAIKKGNPFKVPLADLKAAILAATEDAVRLGGLPADVRAVEASLSLIIGDGIAQLQHFDTLGLRQLLMNLSFGALATYTLPSLLATQRSQSDLLALLGRLLGDTPVVPTEAEGRLLSAVDLGMMLRSSVHLAAASSQCVSVDEAANMLGVHPSALAYRPVVSGAVEECHVSIIDPGVPHFGPGPPVPTTSDSARMLRCVAFCTLSSSSDESIPGVQSPDQTRDPQSTQYRLDVVTHVWSMANAMKRFILSASHKGYDMVNYHASPIQRAAVRALVKHCRSQNRYEPHPAVAAAFRQAVMGDSRRVPTAEQERGMRMIEDMMSDSEDDDSEDEGADLPAPVVAGGVQEPRRVDDDRSTSSTLPTADAAPPATGQDSTAVQSALAASGSALTATVSSESQSATEPASTLSAAESARVPSGTRQASAALPADAAPPAPIAAAASTLSESSAASSTTELPVSATDQGSSISSGQPAAPAATAAAQESQASPAMPAALKSAKDPDVNLCDTDSDDGTEIRQVVRRPPSFRNPTSFHADHRLTDDIVNAAASILLPLPNRTFRKQQAIPPGFYKIGTKYSVTWEGWDSSHLVSDEPGCRIKAGTAQLLHDGQWLDDDVRWK
jgi:hypothetical protein